jgi:hypothetical protein
MSLENYKVSSTPLFGFYFVLLKLIIELVFGVAWHPLKFKFFNYVSRSSEPEIFSSMVWIDVVIIFLCGSVALINHLNKK